MKLIEALAAPRRAELAQKAAEQAAMVRKMSPSQALGGIAIDPGGSTTTPQNDLNPTVAVRDGFKKNVFVYACVTRLASAASSLMWRVERRTGDGERDWEPDPNDWRTKLLAYPNRSMSAKEVFYYAFAWLAINGNGLLRRVAGGGNGPNSTIELWPASPVNVQPVPGPAWIIGYNILENGKVVRKVDPEEFIHCRLPDPLNPLWGVGMLQSAWASVQADVASAEWRKTLYGSGGVPPGAITDPSLTTTELVQEAHANLKRAWQRNAKEVVPMVLGAGTNYLPFGFSAADMMIPQDRELTVAEIATAFGMLPAMFDSSAATYDNLRTAVRFMYDNGVLPLADTMRDALNLSLLTDEERESDSVYITYDLTQVPFFRAEREAKIEQLGKAIRSGISRNDGVNILDLGLEDAEGGDSVFIETGLTLLSEAAEGIKAAPVAGFNSNPAGQPMPDMPDDPANAADTVVAPAKAIRLTVPEFLELAKKYNPNQPRDPGGEGGGQWISGRSSADSALSDDERKALEDWTLSSKWEKLNEALRDGSSLTSDQAEMVKNIDSAISKAPEMDSPVTVFRGINFGQQAMPSGASLAGMSATERVASVRDAMADFAEKRFPVGATVELGGYQSTSKYTAPALDASLSKTSPGIVFQISAKKGIDLSKISRLDDEGEILLPRNSRFKISRVERNATFETVDGSLVTRTVVHAEQI